MDLRTSLLPFDCSAFFYYNLLWLCLTKKVNQISIVDKKQWQYSHKCPFRWTSGIQSLKFNKKLKQSFIALFAWKSCGNLYPKKYVCMFRCLTTRADNLIHAILRFYARQLISHLIVYDNGRKFGLFCLCTTVIFVLHLEKLCHNKLNKYLKHIALSSMSQKNLESLKIWLANRTDSEFRRRFRQANF